MAWALKVNLAHQPDSHALSARSLKDKDPRTAKSNTAIRHHKDFNCQTVDSPLLEKERSDAGSGSEAADAANERTWNDEQGGPETTDWTDPGGMTASDKACTAAAKSET